MRLIITTDASLNTQFFVGGWACVIRDASSRSIIETASGGFKNKTRSVNVAECWAFVNALSLCLKYDPKAIQAYTDSKILIDQFLAFNGVHPSICDAKELGEYISLIAPNLIERISINKLDGHGPASRETDMPWCDRTARQQMRKISSCIL